MFITEAVRMRTDCGTDADAERKRSGTAAERVWIERGQKTITFYFPADAERKG